MQNRSLNGNSKFSGYSLNEQTSATLKEVLISFNLDLSCVLFNFLFSPVQLSRTFRRNGWGRNSKARKKEEKFLRKYMDSKKKRNVGWKKTYRTSRLTGWLAGKQVLSHKFTTVGKSRNKLIACCCYFHRPRCSTSCSCSSSSKVKRILLAERKES